METMISSPVAVASRASSCFQSQDRYPLDPPPSAVMKILRALGYFSYHALPPFFDSGSSEDRCVMVNAYGDPGAVVGQVVDSVGNRFTVSLSGEIIRGHVDWLTLRMPFLAGLREPPDKFLFLRIDADHRLTCSQELLSQIINVSELIIPVWMLASFHLFAGTLQAVTKESEEFRNDRMANRVTHLSELPGKIAC